MAKVIFDGAGEMPELNRITAKKNYASSSQAHKMGATAMFNDILHYLGKEKYPKLINEVEGQVAVRQHPVYAFQKIPIEGSEGQYNRKFIGLFTVGPDKGDKNYFGFTNSRIKDRAIRLEGTDHLKGVGFNYPWTVNGVDKIKYNHAEESLCIITGSDKTKWTKIWEQSVCGDKKTEAEIEAYLKEVYKPAYEVAYHNNPLIVGVDMTLNEINSNIEAFGKRRRVKDNRQYSYCEFWIDGEYDIYYLDAQTNKYEKNGINLLSDLGITADEIAGMTIEEKNNLFISRRVARFKEEAKYYFCIDDAVYQLMFLFIIVASDNFEKNMYPYIMELLWRFFQDDLDSIFSTDNQAQNTKKYSAELHDFTDDTKSAYVFKGEDSAFWQLIELAYEDECKQMGRDIFQAMYDLAPRGTTTMEKLMAFFDEYFFNRAQKYFTPSAYNNDTEYSYEEAWNNKEYVASVDIHPLAQALGSQESTERAFLEKRLIYLMSKFGFGGFASATDTDLGIISVRTQDPQSFTLTPAIDLYPTVLGGQAQSAVATERVMAGQPVTLPAVGGGNTNVYIVGADWLSDIGDLKDLKVDPSSVVTLTISSKRLRRIKVGDENADSVTSYLGSLSIQKCDSLETIDARNLQTLVGTVDLSNCPRLVEALFGGSNANAIIIAPGSKVEKLQFSDSITTIDLRNNTFLKDVEITNFAKIRFLRLENVPIINGFDVLRQAYNTDGQQLENIRIIGFTYTGVADDLFMLSNIAEGKDKDGNTHKYGSIDANGDPDENSLPVIEGSLHITEAVNRSTYDFVQGAFHALALTADNIVDYFIFADPEVNRIVAKNWGDGNDTTVEQIEAVTSLKLKFRMNSTIETFNELYKFTGLSESNGNTGEFQGCGSLKSVKLNKFLIENNSAFNSCNSLESVIIEDVDALESIYNECFRNCKNLRSINIDFSRIKTFGKNCLESCSSLEIDGSSLINAETININAFKDAKLYGELNIQKNKSTDIGVLGSTNLESILDLGAVTTIRSYFVERSPNLKVVHIPSTVTSIGTQTFRKGIALDSFICHATTPPTLGTFTFSDAPNIYVPDASVEAYKTATNWNAYASRIKSIFYYLGYIDFVDPAVRDICIANFDTDGDGVVSMEEAAAVTDIGGKFSGNTEITSFDEFKWFTGVTSLAYGAFNRCSNLRNITLPSSLTSLTNSNIFWGTSIEEIVIPDSVTNMNARGLFRSCVNLRKIVIGANVNNNLPSDTLTDSNNVEEIIFRGNIVSFNFHTTANFVYKIDPSNTAYVENNGCIYNANMSSIVLVNPRSIIDFPSSITTIESKAFSNNQVLTKVVIPNTVTIFGSYIFQNSKITSIRIPSSMKITNAQQNTKGGIVANCSMLSEIIIEDGFGPCTGTEFAINTSIEKIELPESVTIINAKAFYNCSYLISVIINSSNCYLDNINAFTNTPIANGTGYIYVPDNLVEDYKAATNWSTYASQIKGISEMPIEFEDPAVEAICLANWDSDGDGVFTIGDAQAVTDLDGKFSSNKDITSFNELEYFTGLTQLNSPNNWGQFVYCSNLKTIKLPNTLTVIASNCFRETKLEEITIPENVTEIGTYTTFAECRNLKRLIIKSSNITSGAVDQFLRNTPIAAGEGYIYVPDDSVDYYKGFSGFAIHASQIKPLSEYVEE